MIKSLDDLKIKIFADGADKQGMLEMSGKSYIQGLTTNPTLMRKAGISDYKKFSKEILLEITQKPISFEVFNDDLEGMKRQGVEIASWGANVYVKIPITTTTGMSTASVVDYLVNREIKVNVTALMTPTQVSDVGKILNPLIPSYVSVFAGRIADTGLDPVPTMVQALEILKNNPRAELIWASPRELLNIFQGDAIGCHIITATNDILRKLELLGKDLTEYSLDTVKMFRNDAVEAGFDF